MSCTELLPRVVSPFGVEQGCHKQDFCLHDDSTTSAKKLMAQFFVDAANENADDTYVCSLPPAICVGDLEAVEKLLPAAPLEQFEALLRPPAEIAQVATNIEASPVAALDALDGAQFDAQNHCCLENCDRILPHLYLGGVEAAVEPKCLAEQGICAIVCCNRELEFATSKFLPDLEYYRVDVEDMGREPIELFLPEAVEFIHTQLLQERSVLVHCKAGVSRSASVLLAYLMEHCGYSLHDAFIWTLRRRPTITPNPGFMERLRDYEKEKRGMKVASIDMFKYVSWFQAAERCLQPDLHPE